MRAAKVEYFTDETGQVRFRIRAKNGEIIHSSEGYRDKTDAKRGYKDLTDSMRELVSEEEQEEGKSS